MLNQTFSPTELSKVIKKGDGQRYNLWDNISEKESNLCQLSEQINKDDYRIKHIVKQERNGKPVFVINRKEGGVDYLAVRKVDNNLRRIYKVKQADRSEIIRQLVTILEDGSPMHLFKLDILSFYESIEHSVLLNKLKKQQLISRKTTLILKSLFECDSIKNSKGLPRGISISATLSEIFMRKLDRDIKKIDGVYYYSRFVDDIVIVCFANHNEVLSQVNSFLSKNGLKLNLNGSKYKNIDLMGNNNMMLGSFDYLGYQFDLMRNNKKIIHNNIKIFIAESKIKKIKQRIIKAFLSYFKNTDFALLKNRLKFLTGNYPIDKNDNGLLMVGNYYNYPHVTERSSLESLDEFLYSLLKLENGMVGKRIKTLLNTSQIEKLASYSFVRGYYGNGNSKPLVFRFSQKKLIKIVECWKYE